MNINKFTPTTNNTINKFQEKFTPKTKTITEKLLNEVDFIPARLDLELNAERLSPQEYIRARNYLSTIEMNELIKTEMFSL